MLRSRHRPQTLPVAPPSTPDSDCCAAIDSRPYLSRTRLTPKTAAFSSLLLTESRFTRPSSSMQPRGES